MFVEAEDTSQVVYQGSWTTEACSYCSGGAYIQSSGDGRKASLTFEGTSVSVIFVGDVRSGFAEIRVDDVRYPDVNLYNNAAGPNPDPVEYVIATDLAPGVHTVEIKVIGQDGLVARFPSKKIGIDGFRYGDFPFATLRGRVLDPDGDGIPGASVMISSMHETFQVQAGHDGAFSISGLSAGDYDLIASANLYEPQTLMTVQVTAESEIAGLDIKLPEATGHPLFGLIYTLHSNSPTIQPSGTTVEINIKQASNAGNWNVALSIGYYTVPLPIISTSYDPVTAWTLHAAIPADTPAELYDLQVSSNRGTDVQVRAVQVVTHYP